MPAANVTVSAAFKLTPAAAPTFAPVEGKVLEGTAIELSCTTEGATIYYTTDGEISFDTGTWAAYSESNKPVINQDTTLRAVAVKAGMSNSAEATATYTLSPVTEPVVNLINTDGSKTTDNVYLPFEHYVGDTLDALQVEATAEVLGTLSYQWQMTQDYNTKTWKDIDGATGTSYTPSPAPSDTDGSGYVYYRCVVTNAANGQTAQTESSYYCLR
jgi:hypothetical protein